MCNVIITMQFNGLELSAIVKLAKAMVAVDGKVEKSELSVMALEMVKFGVNPDAGMDFWNLADALDFGHAIAVISAMNQEQKKYVTGYLATIMAADGEIADSEVTLWRLISTLANLPAMNIGQFNFDQMIFEDDFTVPVTTYGEYIDDNVVYNQIESLIASTDEPLYVHATTMQNHQPYSDGDSDDEFINYLSRIQHSADGLADFLERLSQIDEPTIVLFVGDHFPSLRGDDGIYSQLNITSENCSTLYEQRYILWNNYGLNTSLLPSEAVSTYYAPYLVMQLIDAPRDSFTQTMMNEMETEPVYSTNYMPMQEADKKLDTLTYDRILGDIVSPSALDVLPDPTEETTETTSD